MSTELVVRLEREAPSLSASVIAAMYEHPFWFERFGERGRKHSNEDGQHHVSYLVQALLAHDPAVLARYARWLRSVLTTRGMCTRHLEENFERLARAIGATIDDSSLATEYLREACFALRYDANPARELQDASPRLADAAAAELERLHPGAVSVWGTSGEVAHRDDLLHYLSYLSDAAEIRRSDGFLGYVAFVYANAVERGRHAELVVAALATLATLVAHDQLLSVAAKAFCARAFEEAAERIAVRAASRPVEARSTP
jgi:hypothetical protein